MDAQNYEEKLVSLVLQNPEILKELRGALDKDYFLNGQYRTIYEVVLGYYEFSDGSIPTIPIILEGIEKKLPKSSELFAPLIERTLEATEPGDIQHLAYYIQAVEEAWRSNQLQNKMLQAISVLKDKKDIERATQILQTELPLSKNKFIQNEVVSDLLTNLDHMEYREAHPELYSGIPIGFPSIDSSTYGHGRGELQVVIGGTGVGKSLTLGQIAVNVAKRGKKVLLITVENSKLSYTNRLYSNIAGIPYYKFKSSKLTDSDKEVWLSAMGNLPTDFYLRVVEFPEGCSARDIWYFMRTLPVEIDYLIVDQITNMFPNDVKEHKPMSWLWFGQIALDLKRLAGYAYGNKGIPITSAAQAAGGTVGKKELTTDDIAMAKIIQHHAHGCLFITKDEDGNFNMGASKYRDALIKLFPVFPQFEFWRVSEQAFTAPQTAGYGRVPSAPPSGAITLSPNVKVAPAPAENVVIDTTPGLANEEDAF